MPLLKLFNADTSYAPDGRELYADAVLALRKLFDANANPRDVSVVITQAMSYEMERALPRVRRVIQAEAAEQAPPLEAEDVGE